MTNFTEFNVPFESARVVVLPVAYDATVTGRKGTAQGPQAILEASHQLELWDTELEVEPSQIGIHTLPIIKPSGTTPEKVPNLVFEKAKELFQHKKFPIILGGEHSISVGIVQAVKENYSDVTVLILDAHADLRDEYEGSKYSHACVTRRILEIASATVLGVRSLAKEEANYINLSADRQEKNNVEIYQDLSLEAIERLSENIYLSIDLDVFDPGIMPSVGTPEPDGFSWQQVLKFVKELISKKKIVGLDVVELCPIPNNPAPDYLGAKLIYKIIGYIYYL